MMGNSSPLLPLLRPGGFIVLAALLVGPGSTSADDFAMSISPPRFELAAKPGETTRAVVELTNASNVSASLAFATEDWELTPDGSVATSAALQPGSCRPWVAIERRSTILRGRTSLRYRFEVTPPKDTPPIECRFALVISSGNEQVATSGGVTFPISARIAVIVYVAIGGVKPNLEITKAQVVKINGVQTPVVMVHNSGQAHGRLSAFLSGTDASGIKREFTPSTLPILPGETRMIPLRVDHLDNTLVGEAPPPSKGEEERPIAYPVFISGVMNDGVHSFKFDGTFAP